MLPIEGGIDRVKFVLLTLKVWRDPLNGKSGKKPRRLLFEDMSIRDNVPMLKTFCGNIPVNLHLESLSMVRLLKWANVSGTGDDKSFSSRAMTDRLSSLAREGSRGPKRLHLDKLSSCKSRRDNKALHHS